MGPHIYSSQGESTDFGKSWPTSRCQTICWISAFFLINLRGHFKEDFTKILPAPIQSVEPIVLFILFSFTKRNLINNCLDPELVRYLFSLHWADGL